MWVNRILANISCDYASRGVLYEKKKNNEKESYNKDSNSGEIVASGCSIHPFSCRVAGGMIHSIAGGTLDMVQAHVWVIISRE